MVSHFGKHNRVMAQAGAAAPGTGIVSLLELGQGVKTFRARWLTQLTALANESSHALPLSLGCAEDTAEGCCDHLVVSVPRGDVSSNVS